MTTVEVSYLIAVRNKVRTIEKCLNSLARNNVHDVVVVDGRSTDGTSEIVDRYSFKHLYDEGRGNIATARNMGLKECKGEYVVIVDGDQWIGKEFNTDLKEILTKAKYDAVFCLEDWVGSSQKAKAGQLEWLEISSLRHHWVHFPRIFNRASICKVGGWDSVMGGSYEDFDLWNRLKMTNPKVFESELVIHNDASDTSLYTELRKGTERASSLVKYVRRYPSEWQRILSIAPVAWLNDYMIALRVFIRKKTIRLSFLVLVLRMARSLGWLIGLFCHPTRRG